MKRSLRLHVTYCRFMAAGSKRYVLEPYCLKLFQRRWYLLARRTDNGEMRIFALDRIEQLSVTADHFTIDLFDAHDFFCVCYSNTLF